jgi:beta-galactosidase
MPLLDEVQAPFGAVYFRKSNPPPADWERDYATAAADGLNVFRHWFLWGAIELAPGELDWADYDRQLDLAAEHGITTIIAEMITVAPEWAYRRYAHARYQTFSGTRLGPTMHGSCVVGGAPGLCLDHADFRAAAEAFLRALVTRYRDHPGLGGYDIWNECNYPGSVCYCPATVADFRAWLRDRYGDLRELGRAWHRYSFETWEDVMPPASPGPYPDALDWLQFRIDNAYEQMMWRAELIRELDPAHPVTAHGVAGTLTDLASNTRDDWRAASLVDGYGLTWVACRKGDATWKQWHALDMTRAAAGGKEFWHAEAQGGPLWLQPQVLGRPREDGRIPSPEDLRLWHLTSFAAGARGLLYPRWRPLLDGPLFGAFGPYGIDGLRTPRSEMTSRLARWANAPGQAALWQARPVQGEVGILVVPETQLYAHLLLTMPGAGAGDDPYARALEGAYRGFFDAGIQADWVRTDDTAALDAYDLLYLPFPMMLLQATATELRDWVAAGGTLVAEGCPGYFGDGGHVEAVQPGLGLDELFGVREAYVEFAPDLVEELTLTVEEVPARGGLFMQAYAPTTGAALGWYGEGAGPAAGLVAAVDHVWGKGQTRLVGTMCGYGYGSSREPSPSPAFFASVAALGGKTPNVRLRHPEGEQTDVRARLHEAPGATFLWVVNAGRKAARVELEVCAQWGPFRDVRVLWPEEGAGTSLGADGRTMAMSVAARDAVILELA